jgi:hypothetical protein
MPPKAPDLKTLLHGQRQNLGASGLISLRSAPVTSLALLKRQPKLRVLDISKTGLTSLESLEPQDALTEIIADESALADFRGLDRHPKLAKFSAISTQLADSPNFRLASLIVIGPMLSSINGSPVTPAERNQIRSFPKIAKYLLLYGWTLEVRDIPEDEYKRIAQQRHVAINGRPFDSLEKSEIRALFQLPVMPKSKAEIEREVTEYIEEIETQAQRLQEQAEDELAGQIAQQLGRIGINVRPGPEMKGEILEALGGLADVVRVLEEAAGGSEETTAE